MPTIAIGSRARSSSSRSAQAGVVQIDGDPLQIVEDLPVVVLVIDQLARR